MDNHAWITQKMDGAKNSFIIISFPSDQSETLFKSQMESKSLAQESVSLCKKHEVDGAVFLKNYQSTAPHYEWDFYNADGSVAEMCGNAARCVTAFTYERELAPKEHAFKTIAGIIKAKYIKPGQTQIKTRLSSKEFNKEMLSIDKKDLEFYSVNSGVPHAVVPLKEFTPDQFKNLAQELREHDHFSPSGTNVTLFSIKSANHINAISFERGVEDYTEACGTGAVAAAYTYYKLENTGPRIKVQMPGGLLEIDFSDDEPWLIGPVRYI